MKAKRTHNVGTLRALRCRQMACKQCPPQWGHAGGVPVAKGDAGGGASRPQEEGGLTPHTAPTTALRDQTRLRWMG